MKPTPSALFYTISTSEVETQSLGKILYESCNKVGHILEVNPI